MPNQTSETITYVPLEAGAVPAIYVETFADWTAAAPHESEPAHRHNFHLLMWFQAGRGRHRIDQGTVEIAPQTLCLIPRGWIHRFESTDNLAGFVVAWSADVFQSDHDYPQALLQTAHEALALPASEQAEWAVLAQLIGAEYSRVHAVGQSALLRHLVCALLIRVERLRYASALPQPATSANALRLYQNFIRLLDQHYFQQHAVGFYADRLGISASRLSRVLQQIAGKATKDLIQERLVLEAKRYLHFSDLSIKQISAILGYADPLHFSRIFKRATLLSPQQYREQRHKMP